jgi:hypothetical protein
VKGRIPRYYDGFLFLSEIGVNTFKREKGPTEERRYLNEHTVWGKSGAAIAVAASRVHLFI